ncbi:nitroreductase/quinone reductase family protein [Microbacterium sp.]|uniref:nitroreductase/quinone reductase family protein n=1 Tax=Microbacterium sp. TaxID=51671 RepID=UPI0028113268|nr:nitroreductase/quinone reductase family protein [Microbacterium sp.]
MAPDTEHKGPGADPARIPPRWFITTAWRVHRGLYRMTGGRFGLRRPTPRVFGMMRLHTIGRRSGAQRMAILAYFEDGPNLVTMAMNGWGDPPPAWWLNLQANPVASVDLPGGEHRSVIAREARGAERDRLWEAFRAMDSYDGDLNDLAALRSRETPVIVLEPLV